MKEIRLYGHLGEKFGKSHRLDVGSPAEAARALCAVLPGFTEEFLGEDGMAAYRVYAGGHTATEETAELPHSAPVIRFVPIVEGSGGGFGKILLGGALLFGMTMFPGFAGPEFGLLGQTFTMGGIMKSIGMSLILGGLSQLLFKPPSPPKAAVAPERKPSYLFDGAVNNTGQGAPIPIAYGEILVGSQVISTGLSTEQIPV